ncbi:MAG: DUF309 domain-containing protein [Campylobacterales bacterium]|nr:DUF309 domain-containing protein [Campylobacterales bacterium]
MIDKQIERFINFLDADEYFEAHEMLEIIWHPRRFEDDDEIRVLKGFINAAVSFELIKRGRFPQSKRVWKNYLKYKLFIKNLDPTIKDKYIKLSLVVERKSNILKI